MRITGRIMALALFALVPILSCSDAHESEPVDSNTIALPTIDESDPMVTKMPDGSYLYRRPGMAPSKLIIPEREPGDENLEMPDGVFLRPHVDLFPINAEKKVDIAIDMELSEGETTPIFLRAKNDLADELRAAGPGDALMIADTPGYIVARWHEDGDDLVIETRPFNIFHLIWGNFRIEYAIPAPAGQYEWNNPDTGLNHYTDGFVETEAPLPFDYQNMEDRLYTNQQDLTLPFGGLKIDFTRTYGSGPLAAEIKTEGEVKMYVTGDMKGIFEGKIGRAVGSSYNCLNPEDEHWYGDFCIDRLAAYVEGGMDMEMAFGFEVTGKLTSGDAVQWEKTFATPEVPIGGTPLAASPEPFVRWGAEFEAAFQAKVGGTWTGNARVPFGFEYLNGTQFRRPNLTGNPNDGTYLIPNARIPARVSSGGVQWSGVELDGYLGAKPYLDGGVRLKVSNVGPDVIKLTGASLFVHAEYEVKYRPIQQDTSTAKCLEGEAKLFGQATPDLTFQAGIEGIKTWKKQLFCAEGQRCATLKTPNIFSLFRVPERYWKHSTDSVCLSVPTYRTVTITPVSDEPISSSGNDVPGFDVDSICLTRQVRRGQGPGAIITRTYCANSGPSKAQGRPDSTCNNFSSKVAGITGPTDFRFPVNIIPGDTITVVQTQNAAGCDGSGTASITVKSDGSSPTRNLGVIEQNGEVVFQ